MWPEFTNHIPLLTSSEKSWTVRSALTIWRHPRNHCIHSCHSPLQSSVLDSGISFWQGSSLSQQVIQQRFGDVTVACCDMAGISAQLDRSWHLHTAFLLFELLLMEPWMSCCLTCSERMSPLQVRGAAGSSSYRRQWGYDARRQKFESEPF